MFWALSAASFAALPATAAHAASDTSALEAENSATVGELMKIFSDPKTDEARIAGYFTDDCVLKLTETIEGTTPLVVGRKQVAAMLYASAGLNSGRSVDIRTVESMAFGPVVVNFRRDGLMSDGKTRPALEHYSHEVGVFYLKNGKIKEWINYLLPET
jgi:limonene-1,2-epoxide hydrolase